MHTAVVIVSATILSITAAITATNWYEYDWAPNINGGMPNECRTEYRAAAAKSGWEIAPNQPDPCFVRRPRIRLP